MVTTAAASDAGESGKVYVGKGKWLKDDARKYPSRTTLTGGWAGGEVGLWNFRDAEKSGVGVMVPPADDDDDDDAEGDDGNGDGVDDVVVASRGAVASSFGGGGNAGVATVKYSLLKTLAALDRGVAAGDTDRDRVRELVETLETLAKATAMSSASARKPSPSSSSSLAPTDAALEAALDGEWRLAYSSTFAGEQSGSQGFTGAPGGGPGGGNPNLGSVYQRRGLPRLHVSLTHSFISLLDTLCKRGASSLVNH